MSDFMNFCFHAGIVGMRFTTGIAFATVTGAADTDATAVTAADLRWAFNYI